MNINVLWAVLQRNFISYFSSPMGYIFIMVFVALSSIAAFWPAEFFNANLANLTQLNNVFPAVMLVFIPAISMSIWAEERRQGTDELLLTIPAGDTEIVLGKYLAAALIYTTSLLFSLVCNLIVLITLGNPDPGLFLSTYFGYWLVGLAMISIGMVASFLTANLTVAYILGALLNVPLVLMWWADTISSRGVATTLRSWSIGGQFFDLGRGVISFASIVYFATLVAVGLYVSMVLIARRHWFAGATREMKVLHYAGRAVALLVIGVAANYFFRHHDLRWDVTSEKLSTLAPASLRILADLDNKQPVMIEAFISPEVPEDFVRARTNLQSGLKEIQARAGGKVLVQEIPTEPSSDEANTAERRYGIRPQKMFSKERGATEEREVFMHVAVKCGTQSAKPIFFNRGTPVEYELIHAIAMVTRQERKKIGIVATDAQVMGRTNFQMQSSSSDWAIVDELKKQYEVVAVDPSTTIDTKRIDAMLAVQPSSLDPKNMNNFIAAVEAGVPTLIFEDPMPAFVGNVPPTSQPREPPGGMNMMMMQRGGFQPKGDIDRLWKLLGVRFSPEQITWQNYNPFPKAPFPDEYVFVDADAGELSDASPVTSGLQSLMFPFPGSIGKVNASALRESKWTDLVRTGERTGTIKYGGLFINMGDGRMLNPFRRHEPTAGRQYTLAAEISGKLKEDEKMAPGDPDDMPDGMPGMPPGMHPGMFGGMPGRPPMGGSPSEPDEKPAKKSDELHVILVADVDMLTRDFFSLREQGEFSELGIYYPFDNVTFVLNCLDDLAGDKRFIELRKRRPKHRSLTRVDSQTKEMRDATKKARDELNEEVKDFEKGQIDRLKEIVDKLRKSEDMDDRTKEIQLQQVMQQHEKRDRQRLEDKRRESERKTRDAENKLKREVRNLQHRYKLLAVLLPPIPPLVVGIIVFAYRRKQEREGVARSRLK